MAFDINETMSIFEEQMSELADMHDYLKKNQNQEVNLSKNYTPEAIKMLLSNTQETYNHIQDLKSKGVITVVDKSWKTEFEQNAQNCLKLLEARKQMKIKPKKQSKSKGRFKFFSKFKSKLRSIFKRKNAKTEASKPLKSILKKTQQKWSGVKKTVRFTEPSAVPKMQVRSAVKASSIRQVDFIETTLNFATTVHDKYSNPKNLTNESLANGINAINVTLDKLNDLVNDPNNKMDAVSKMRCESLKAPLIDDMNKILDLQEELMLKSDQSSPARQPKPYIPAKRKSDAIAKRSRSAQEAKTADVSVSSRKTVKPK